MSATLGTIIGSQVVPTDTTDTYPTHDAAYGKGGWREVADTTARDAITASRRTEGMVVYCISDEKEYQLVNGITNSDWVEYVGGVGPQGVTGLQGAAGAAGAAGAQGIQGVTGLSSGIGFTGMVLGNQVIYGVDIPGPPGVPSNIITGDYGFTYYPPVGTLAWDNYSQVIAEKAKVMTAGAGANAIDSGGVSIYSGMTGAVSGGTTPLSVLALSSAWLTNTLTLLPIAEMYGSMGPYSTSSGGLNIRGWSNSGGTPGIQLCGYVGGTSFVSGYVGAINLNVSKSDGANGLASIAANEIALQITNNDSDGALAKRVFNIYGDGHVQIPAGARYYVDTAKVPFGGGVTGAAGAAAGYITLTINDIPVKLLYQT